MPVYEYICRSCDDELEVILLPGEPEPTACPTCGDGLERTWSRLAASFQGWGFASNDALLPSDRPRKPFKQIKDKASELFD